MQVSSNDLLPQPEERPLHPSVDGNLCQPFIEGCLLPEQCQRRDASGPLAIYEGFLDPAAGVGSLWMGVREFMAPFKTPPRGLPHVQGSYLTDAEGHFLQTIHVFSTQQVGAVN